MGPTVSIYKVYLHGLKKKNKQLNLRVMYREWEDFIVKQNETLMNCL